MIALVLNEHEVPTLSSLHEFGRRDGVGKACGPPQNLGSLAPGPQGFPRVGLSNIGDAPPVGQVSSASRRTPLKHEVAAVPPADFRLVALRQGDGCGADQTRDRQGEGSARDAAEGELGLEVGVGPRQGPCSVCRQVGDCNDLFAIDKGRDGDTDVLQYLHMQLMPQNHTVVGPRILG